MEKGFLKWIFLIVFVLLACDTEPVPPGQVRSFEIESMHTGATYDIRVALPEDYDENRTYNTIYLLDQSMFFDHAIREADRVSGDVGVRNVIVVGIGGGNDRMTDFSPTETSMGDGGASSFTAFLRDELIPRIELRHTVDESREGRGIMGHSASGLFAGYAFTQQNDLFGNYFLLSPSLWYDEGICLQYESENRADLQAMQQLVYFSIGEIEATQLFAKMMYERLKEHYQETQLKFYTVSGKDHSSSAKKGITEGLRFYFGNQQ